RAGAASSRPSRSKCRAERTAPPVRNGGPGGAGPLPCGSKGRGSGPRPSTRASCLEREPRLRVPACALDAMRRSHGHRIGGAQEREPEAAPRRRVPAVRGFSGHIDPSGVPEAKYPQLARDQDEEPGEGQPQLDVPEDRGVASEAMRDEAAHRRVPADIGTFIGRIGPPDFPPGDADGERRPQRNAGRVASMNVLGSSLVWANLNTGLTESFAADESVNSSAGATRYCCGFTL